MAQRGSHCRGGRETAIMERMLPGAQLRSQLLLINPTRSSPQGRQEEALLLQAPLSALSSRRGTPWGWRHPGPRVPVTVSAPSPCAVTSWGKLPVCSFHLSFSSSLRCVLPKLPGGISLTLIPFISRLRGEGEGSGKGAAQVYHPSPFICKSRASVTPGPWLSPRHHEILFLFSLMREPGLLRGSGKVGRALRSLFQQRWRLGT